MTFNPEDYRHHLSNADLTDAQKDEVLRELWKAMQAFVDVAWGQDTVTLARENTPLGADQTASSAPEKG